jgi:hypothetical protein
MHEEIYADGVGEITVTGNIVRIDFVSLSPTQRDDNNKPKTVFRQRVVMPTEAFANTTELMKNVLRGLIESGAIKMQQAPTPPDRKSDDVKGVPRSGSPNFG